MSSPPLSTRHRVTKGYARSRQAYDRRRRRHPLDAIGKQYKEILQSDPCSNCGHVPQPGGELNAADHVVPLAAGGDNVWDNLTSLCRPCNASKKGEGLLLWLWRLRT